jgi:hypothetical protein
MMETTELPRCPRLREKSHMKTNGWKAGGQDTLSLDKLPPCFPRPPLGSLPLTLLELTFSKDILSTSDIN